MRNLVTCSYLAPLSAQIMVISRVEVDTTWTGLAGVVPSQRHGSVAFVSNFRTVDPYVALDF